MLQNVSFTELEDIYSKYERLQSMIGILQMFTAEIVEIAGAPSNSLTDALFEIEMGMGEANDRLKSVFMKNGTNSFKTSDTI